MAKDNVIFFDGQKAIDMNNPDVWTVLSGDPNPKGIAKLYQTVSWLYRCVQLRSNSVASMPYTLLQGKKEIAVWSGTDFEDDLPPKMEWLIRLNDLLAKTEAASCLVGGAYWGRRKNILGTRDLKYDWMLPSSIAEIYNGVPGIGGMKYDSSLRFGELLGFWRYEPYYGIRELAPGTIREIPIEEMVYFWYPDYGVEIGRAINTPGRAVLQNAGVVSNLDIFLFGYFERGLVKAFLGKFNPTGNNTMAVPPSNDEVSRFKQWIRRTLQGIQNANNIEIVRGDFSIETVGEGVKDLRDNELNRDEKEAIAIGMGVPLSKLNSTSATDSNRDADERAYIEDTIIPEIAWIYEAINEQILNPLGMRIKANPDTLRVMQEDERQRAAAWSNYVNGGMSLELATVILGIDIPDGMEIKEPPKPIPPALQPFAGQTPPPQQQEEDEEQEEEEEVIEKSVIAVLELLDRREEQKQFERWLKNRNYTAIKVDEFASEHLSEQDKIEIACKALPTTYKASRIDELQTDYGNKLAKLIDNAIKEEYSKNRFVTDMRDVVYTGLLSVFKEAASVPQNENLSPEESDKFNNLLITELERVSNYADDIYGAMGKATRFDRVRDKLQTFAGNLGGRLSAWTNAARMVFNQGMIFGRRDIKMRWEFGATEQHCSDCLFYNGQVKSREEWLQLAGILIHPQSRALQCRGYNCDCRLVEA